jgi:hypothetical protein
MDAERTHRYRKTMITLDSRARNFALIVVAGLGLAACNRDKEDYQKLSDRASGPIREIAKNGKKIVPDTKDSSDEGMLGAMLESAQACISLKEPAEKLANMSVDDLRSGGIPRLDAETIRDGARALARAADDCKTVGPMECMTGCANAYGTLSGQVAATRDSAKEKGVDIPPIDID